MPHERPRVCVALLHFPVYNKAHEVVATSLTTLNLHDLARLTTTYGIHSCYIVTPLRTQQEVAQRMIAHWTHGYGATYNPTRAEALQTMSIVDDLAAVEQDILQRHGVAPRMIATDARRFPGSISYTALRHLVWQHQDVFLLLLGTGWGIAEPLITRCEYILAPIYGPTPYNHLPVRVAAGIILDRLLGQGEPPALGAPSVTYP